MSRPALFFRLALLPLGFCGFSFLGIGSGTNAHGQLLPDSVISCEEAIYLSRQTRDLNAFGPIDGAYLLLLDSIRALSAGFDGESLADFEAYVEVINTQKPVLQIPKGELDLKELFLNTESLQALIDALLPKEPHARLSLPVCICDQRAVFEIILPTGTEAYHIRISEHTIELHHLAGTIE